MGLHHCILVTMCMRVNGIFTHPPFCIICCQAYLAHVNCANSMQGRFDKVLSTEICMKVSERIQIVFKMQVSILHPAFDTLCCLLLHVVSVLEHVVAHLTRVWESVALWTQPNKLLHRHRIQFVLEESDCLAIHSAMEGMVEGVFTGIIVSRSIPRHISIDIFCLDSIGQTIRVREQQSQLITAWLFYTHVIVVKVIHVQH